MSLSKSNVNRKKCLPYYLLLFIFSDEMRLEELLRVPTVTGSTEIIRIQEFTLFSTTKLSEL